MLAGFPDKQAYDRAYRIANRVKINARRRAKYASCPKTRERIRAQSKRTYERVGAEYSRRYYAANRTHIRKRANAWTYGLTIAEFDALVAAQGNRCALCGLPAKDTPQGSLVIDHCHADGRVRGLLCHQCNTDLGVIEKRRAQLDKFLNYSDNAKADRQ